MDMKKIFLALALATLMGCQADGGGLDGNGGGGNGGGGGGGGTAGDADGDGVADAADLCPGTRLGALVDADGCSVYQVDSDDDGVVDGFDLCPGTPAGETVDANGCAVSQYGPNGSAPLPEGLVCTDYLAGTASTAGLDSGLCALGPVLDAILNPLGASTCAITDPELAADGDSSTFAGMETTVAGLAPVLGIIGEPLQSTITLAVSSFGTRPAGSLAAFEIEYPNSTADVTIAANLEVATLLNGVEQEFYDAGELLGLGLLGLNLITVDGRLVVGFIASLPYDQIEVRVDASVAELDLGLDTSEVHVYVYDMCTDGILDDTVVAP